MMPFQLVHIYSSKGVALIGPPHTFLKTRNDYKIPSNSVKVIARCAIKAEYKNKPGVENDI